MAKLNVRGTGNLVLDVPSGWTVVRQGTTVRVEGPGVLMGIHNFKRSTFAHFEQNERQRYSSFPKEQGVVVTESEVSLGECVGIRWLAKYPERYIGHYLLRNDRAFVLVELFRADTEKSVREIEAALATISIQPGDPPPSRETESIATLRGYKYQCWEGGPHILLPDYLRRDWRGVGAIPLDAASDYGRACAVPGDFGLIQVGAGQALVLAQSPPMVAWSANSPAGVQDVFVLKSWQQFDLDGLLDEALSRAVFRDTGSRWVIPKPGAALYYAGDDPAKPLVGRIDIPLQAGTHKILSSIYADTTRGEVVVIRLELQHDS
jgi:hypothetical protein